MGAISKTLSEMCVGERGIVVAFGGGGDFQQRIASLGLFVGCEVEKRGGAGGGVLVAVGDSRIALGAGMAQKVMIV